MSRFANVSCSQCGNDFGPGDHGFSHCEDHRIAAEWGNTMQQAAHFQTMLKRMPNVTRETIEAERREVEASCT